MALDTQCEGVLVVVDALSLMEDKDAQNMLFLSKHTHARTHTRERKSARMKF